MKLIKTISGKDFPVELPEDLALKMLATKSAYRKADTASEALFNAAIVQPGPVRQPQKRVREKK